MKTQQVELRYTCGRVAFVDRPIVGWLTVDAGHKYTKNYECAAWYRTLALEPGKYPVVDYGNENPHCRFRVKVPGRVVGSDFTSLFCGNRIGEAKTDEDIGQEDVACLFFPEYVFACVALNGHMYGKVELEPEYSAHALPPTEDGIVLYRLKGP